MKRIIIICEGSTEQEFCKDVLLPHFLKHGTLVQFPTIKKTGGGITYWLALKNQIENHLKQDNTAYVSTLIDYYGIYESHNFPGWQQITTIPDKFNRLNKLEEFMKNDIAPAINTRFIPYVQLHEFEGLLFNDISIFTNNFTTQEFTDFEALKQTIEHYPNPELINDNIETAPSKRLEKLIKGYRKIVYGACLAEEIGIKKIRLKSIRFDEWISKLESL